jgi:hypothetical protein
VHVTTQEHERDDNSKACAGMRSEAGIICADSRQLDQLEPRQPNSRSNILVVIESRTLRRIAQTGVCMRRGCRKHVLMEHIVESNGKHQTYRDD